MHQDGLALGVDEGAAAQPVEQLFPVRGEQHGLQRILAVHPLDPPGHHEQMQVMVSEHRHRRLSQAFHEAQHFEGRGPAVDQVAGEP